MITKPATVIGLTGNIASGKSHIAEIFRGLGAVVHNADIAAHEVMNNEAFSQVSAEFPDAVENGQISRPKLGAAVFGNDEKLKKLEAILHPLVRRKTHEFIEANKGKIVLLEIPLLFETKAKEICDYVVFVHVSPKTQKNRALARQGMTVEKLQKILSRQEKISIEEKMKKADFVIENEPGRNITAEVEAILDQLTK